MTYWNEPDLRRNVSHQFESNDKTWFREEKNKTGEQGYLTILREKIEGFKASVVEKEAQVQRLMDQ